MAEYIKRQSIHAMVKSLKQYSWTSPVSNETHVTVAVDDLALKIDKIPAADAAPVVRGLWIGVDSSYWRWTPSGGISVAHITYQCNRCGRGSVTRSKYCPNCGARMDGGDDNA